MTYYPWLKHVDLLDTSALLYKYSCVLTNTNFVQYTIIILWLSHTKSGTMLVTYQTQNTVSNRHAALCFVTYTVLHGYHITQTMLYINFTELHTMKLKSAMCFDPKYWHHQVPFMLSASCYINITALHAQITLEKYTHLEL